MPFILGALVLDPSASESTCLWFRPMVRATTIAFLCNDPGRPSELAWLIGQVGIDLYRERLGHCLWRRRYLPSSQFGSTVRFADFAAKCLAFSTVLPKETPWPGSS